MTAMRSVLFRRVHLEMKVEQEEWLPDDFDDINRMFHHWGLASEPQEVGWAVAFDADRRLRTAFEVARGQHSSLEIHVPSLIGGIVTSGADRWVFVHNHPSGDQHPSGSDFALMEYLREVSSLCGLYLEDGIILTADPDRVYSFLIEGTYRPKPYGDYRLDETVTAIREARIEGQLSVSPA